MAAEWYFRVTGAEFGPISAPELVQQVAGGKIGPDTEVRKGSGSWAPASRVDGLFDRAAQIKVASGKAVVPPSLAPEESSVFVPAANRPFATAPSSIKYEVVDTAEDDTFRVEILAYSSLGGAKDHQTAAAVYFANQAGIRLKQVRMTLRDGEAIAESGCPALHARPGSHGEQDRRRIGAWQGGDE